MSTNDIETQLAANHAEIETLKVKLAASVTTWPAFLALPLTEQENLRLLLPERVAQLKRDHFRKFEV